MKFANAPGKPSPEFVPARARSQRSISRYNCLGPQHALASSQQADPVVQQSCMAAQQPMFSAQQLWPFSQQASFASATQQALGVWQQARFKEQQSSAFLSAIKTLTPKRPRMQRDAVNNLANMRFLQRVKWGTHTGQSAPTHVLMRAR
jgi:hypothetical protein